MERCSGIQVRSGEATEALRRAEDYKTYKELSVTKEQQRRREAGLMHERYIGVAFEKCFGDCGIFVGVVQEIWRHDDKGYFARVYYEEDEDVEDISIAELDSLLRVSRNQKEFCECGYNGRETEMESIKEGVQNVVQSMLSSGEIGDSRSG